MDDIVEKLKGSEKEISQEDMEKIFYAYAPLVKFIAYRLALRLPSHVEVDDLISNGILGLIDAVEKYDTSKQTRFRTYAEIRIKGAMIDSLRSMDWVPRSVRHKAIQVSNVYEEMEQELGRYPEDEEVATRLNININEFYELLNEARGIPLISLDGVEWINSKGEKKSLLESLSNPKSSDPLLTARIDEIKNIIADAIDKLSEKERLVISLYYYEELTMKEIGEVMSLTESRVSQLHTKAVLKLKTKLRRIL